MASDPEDLVRSSQGRQYVGTHMDEVGDAGRFVGGLGIARPASEHHVGCSRPDQRLGC